MSAASAAEKLRIEGQLVRAFHEAGIERRERLRAEQQSAAKDEEHALELEARHATAVHLKHMLKEAHKASAVMVGKVQTIEGRLVRAIGEHASDQKKAAALIEELSAQVEEQTLKAQRALELKAIMAKRKRDADKRAGTADLLRDDLDKARKQLTDKRKEITSLRIQAQLHAQEFGARDDDDDDDDASSSAETSSHSSSDSDFVLRGDQSSSNQLSYAEALTRLSSMPTWRPIRGKGCGRGRAKMEWGTRVIIYSLLAMMVPPSAIGMAIVAIVTRTAHWLRPAAPTYETVQRCRFELRLVEEALAAARRVAAAFRLRSIGFDETTKLGNTSLTSNLQIEPTAGAAFEDVVLRAAYCPLGGTSELAVSSIETKCFSRLRDHLRRWKTQFEKMFPSDGWTGPDASMCSLHRLGGGGAIMSDTCNQARRSKQLLADLIAEQVEQHVGAEAWTALSDAERAALQRTHQCDCWQHIRNIFLSEMSAAQARHVQDELKPELDTFAGWERMTTEFAQLLRASFKEFHHSCRYYKGKGRSFTVWLRQTYPTDFAIHLERADGGRQDLDYDAAVPLYVDRKYFVEYLHGLVFAAKHSNILEDFLYVTFSAVQYIAMVRANALIDILISRPMRWLSGKSAVLHNWSPYSMGAVLDIVEQFFEKAQHDGSLFLDPDLDLFESIADAQPMFAQWRHHMFNEDHVLSPDGSTKHLIFKLVRQELIDPIDATNRQTRSKTIEYLEVQCRAALRKMHEPKLALRDKLSSQNGTKRGQTA